MENKNLNTQDTANSDLGAVSGSAFSIHDLKCGNILNYDTAEGEILPTVIDWQDLKWLTEDPKGFNLVHSPIYLSGKWLEKLGFVKTDDYGDQIYYEPKDRGNRNYYICFDHDVISFGLIVFGNCTNLLYDDANLQFVHQFQNLYYALTGVELSAS